MDDGGVNLILFDVKELNKVINIYFMACEYKDDYWKDIVDCFEKSTLKIEGIP